MKLSLLLTAALLLLQSVCAAQSPQPTASVQDATQQIQAVVEAFRTSIIEKDKAKFLGTLHSENIPWIGIYEAQTFRRMREASAEPEKRSRELKGNAKSFIEGIVKSSEKYEEKFWNIQITTDGSIGTVVFDYNFQFAGKVTNWGKESWHVVNTDAGWKINSVIYTVTLPEPPKRPEITMPSGVLGDYVGKYAISPSSNVVIALLKGRLTASLDGESPVFLFAENNARFFDKQFDSTFEFVRDARGAITGGNFTLDGQTVKARRLPQ